MGANERRGRVAVRPYGWYWWTNSSFHKFESSREALQSAKRLLSTSNDWRIGLTKLNEVVNNYPGTEAAQEAKAMLSRLEEASKDLPKSKVR